MAEDKDQNGEFPAAPAFEAMQARLAHLHTYFLFPFSIDKLTVLESHRDVWAQRPHWIDGLDAWIGAHQSGEASPLLEEMGPWRRASYSQFDMESRAYQDMVFFHPYVRRVFFDTTDNSRENGESESLLRCYTIPVPADARLWLTARDVKGRSAKVEVTDLRLFLFANGIGILSIGVESFQIPVSEALWVNEAMRKVYPSSGRQLREGRVPNCARLVLERGGASRCLAEEQFETGVMIGFLPPLSKLITSLLYFANYGNEEFEPVLDERMIVYTYAVVDPRGLPEDFADSEEYQILMSRLLYVDRAGNDYRYDRAFIRQQMSRHLYRRWAHQGTFYGFTSYSNLTASIGQFDCDEHELREGFLIHRMFSSRYYLMVLIALFYRVTLLDFAERTALVSRRLYRDQEDNKLSTENIRLAADLRADFLHFSNYWHFDELANKDEEVEHFTMQCEQFRVFSTKHDIEEEIEKLNASLHSHYQFRNTEAINRLAMLSLILGAGAVITGFFGMNFGGDFVRLFLTPERDTLVLHYTVMILVSLFAFASLTLGAFVVFTNWHDYRESILPRWWLQRKEREGGSLRRGPGAPAPR